MTLILKQSTAIDIRMGPFLDATDAVTPETGITLGTADQAEVLKANGAATAAMAGTFTAVTGADGWYDYTVATGDVDTVGEVVFIVQDASICLPVLVRGQVIEEAVYDNLYLAAATAPATEAKQDAAQTDLDIITDTDGVVLGAAAVDLVWDEVLTGGTHNITSSAGKRVRELQELGIYEGGQVFIDTVDGAAGTTDYENGTSLSSVDLLASANTIATSLGLHKFNVSNDSTITFVASQTAEVWKGEGWTLLLGGQDISQSHFYHCNDVTGIGTTATGEAHFLDSHIGNVTLGVSHLTHCTFGGTFTVGIAGNYTIDRCASGIAGPTSPIFDMGAAIGGTNMRIGKYEGGATFNNLAAGDVLTLQGDFGTVTLNGADATVEIRGTAKAVVNNLTGSPSVSDDTLSAQVNAEVVDVLKTDVITLPGQEAPPLTPTFEEALSWVYKGFRNHQDGSGSIVRLYADNGTTVDATRTAAESAGVLTVGKWIAGT